jgi:hypothetical protein
LGEGDLANQQRISAKSHQKRTSNAAFLLLIA